jgi:REP element-mobilizing transposase RayT
MPRKPRIEYPGAIYHILNRGNYRRSVFSTEGSKKSFEQTLFDACDRYHWILHAHCIMQNHYHAAIETLDANLSAGMQWLQSTFANRFNKLRKANGHLFQGRYKSLIVERDEYLGSLLHYIHLNPVRVRLCEAVELTRFRWSNLWYMDKKKQRPDCLNTETCLRSAGYLSDSRRGWHSYLQYLEWLACSEQEQKKRHFDTMCKGWALGSRAFKKAVLKDHAETVDLWKGFESREARELYWDNLLDKLLMILGKDKADIESDNKSASWKVMVAYYLKTHTAVSNGWISKNLNMGAVQGVSRYVAAFVKEGLHQNRDYKQMTLRITT